MLKRLSFASRIVGALVVVAGLMPAIAASAMYDLDSLARAASERGWTTARDAQGSLLLYPRATAQDSERTVDPAIASPATPPVDRLAALEKRLVATGWSVSRDSDGSLLLFLPTVVIAQATPLQSRRAVPTGTFNYQRQTPPGQLARALSRRDWQTAQDGNGNLLLYLG